jgi:LemA protein
MRRRRAIVDVARRWTRRILRAAESPRAGPTPDVTMTTIHARSPHPARRGAALKGCLIASAVVVGLLFVVGLWLVSVNNGQIAKREGAEAAWSNVESEYKRRYDLVPNLVATVQGAADFEQQTITAVTEARASVGRVQITGVPDAQQMQSFLQAQEGLAGALQRLMVVAENYPTLRATGSFQDLQVQLEGTENRINVARQDYNSAVATYNVSIQAFPGLFLAALARREKMVKFEASVVEHETPKVDFGGQR